ncbi:MAG: HEAT repeat domain-containing protein [Anaerolineae bacterium]|nr:HEAT repeat domain-containing protein [Anaerolineae bacterium]MDW8070842.1 HEAT repeat domain-containing protein [Anaerolineae bacterium]
MITYYCPSCWSTVAADTEVCPVCGASTQDRQADIVEKYIAALRHPEPMTRLRAAWMLGRMRAERAVPALMQLVMARQANDPYVVSAAAKSLGLIGSRDALPCLMELLRDANASFMARAEAAEALERIGGAEAWATLADIDTHRH